MTVQAIELPAEVCDQPCGRRPVWADLPPGPGLAAALAEAEQHGMDDYELAEAMAAYRRLASWAEARQMDTIVTLSNRRRRGPAAKVLNGTRDCSEFVPVEVGLILGLTDYSATMLTKRAHTLANRLPVTVVALEAGEVDMRKVLIILDKTEHLTDELCAQVERVVVPQAMVQTTAQLRDTVDREVAIADPDTAEKRRTEAIAQRRLARHTTDHGTSGLYLLDAPPELTAAIYHRATAVARAMKTRGGRCSMGVLRADILTAWGLGADPAALHECDQHSDPDNGRRNEPPAEPGGQEPPAEHESGYALMDDPPEPPGFTDQAETPDATAFPDPAELPDLPPPPEPPVDWDDIDPACDVTVGVRSGTAAHVGRLELIPDIDRGGDSDGGGPGRAGADNPLATPGYPVGGSVRSAASTSPSRWRPPAVVPNDPASSTGTGRSCPSRPASCFARPSPSRSVGVGRSSTTTARPSTTVPPATAPPAPRSGTPYYEMSVTSSPTAPTS